MDTNLRPNPPNQQPTLHHPPGETRSSEPVTPAAAAPTEPEPAISSEPSGLHDLFSTIGVLLTALAVAFLLIMFVFRSYQVDGPSMQTTLQNADKLIIWKVPRTWARITHHDYIPKRGDIIVFTESGLSQFGQADSKQLIKRVIGLPGDRVVVKNGEITVFNAANPNGFQPDKTQAYGSVIQSTSGDLSTTLKAGQLFVCGDNRPDSLDSRSFGPIEASQVIGQLVLRVFPLNQAKPF